MLKECIIINYNKKIMIIVIKTLIIIHFKASFQTGNAKFLKIEFQIECESNTIIRMVPIYFPYIFDSTAVYHENDEIFFGFGNFQNAVKIK